MHWIEMADTGSVLKFTLSIAREVYSNLPRRLEGEILKMCRSAVARKSILFCVAWGDRSIAACGTTPLQFASPHARGGGGTPLYGLYRYVRPQRVWFFSRFGHK